MKVVNEVKWSKRDLREGLIVLEFVDEMRYV